MFCVIFMLLLISGCATVSKGAAVSTHEEEIIIDSFQEVQIGRAMAEEVIKKGCPPWRNAAQQLYINKIGQRIARVCGRQGIVYHFMILDSPDLNAFALPGGYIFIYRGLFERLSEDELAAILAHEAAHVVSRDAVRKMQSDLGYPVMAGLVLFALGQKDPQLEQELPRLRALVFEALSRGYDSKTEIFADSLAVEYLKHSENNPIALIDVLEFLEKEKGPQGRVFEISSTPSVMRERIQKIQKKSGSL